MPSLGLVLRGLLCGNSNGDAATPQGSTVITRPGLFDATPDVTLSLMAPGPKVLAALTGPDQGVTSLQKQPLGVDIPWTPNCPQQHESRHQQSHHQQQQDRQQQQHHHHHHQQQQQLSQQQRAWGSATSLYDVDPLTGQRNGDPIADCYSIIAYQQGSIMALADGVNWGERPKTAARAAVLGFCASLHMQLAYTQGGRKLSTQAAFAALRTGVLAAQQQVLAAAGTLTTLVGAVVCPKRWGGGHVLLAVGVGDSPCFVWREATGTVEEVTYMPPLHGFHRDPRVCPGCLGHALGDQPDLSNITFSLTHLQQGDLVFLTSDGIADNFDPVMRKQALASALPSKSPRASAAAQAAAQAALSGPMDLTSHLYDNLCPASPATCHARAMADMSKVLRGACSKQQQQIRLQPPRSLQQQEMEQKQQQPGAVCGPGPVCIESIDASLATSTGSSGGGSGQQPLGTGSSNKSALSELPAFTEGAALTPQAAVDALMAFATAVTDAQRRVLEEAGATSSRQQEVADILANLPGKLDHACVVAYKVGS